MADYESFPLWSRGENLDPLTLLLSCELTARLLAWADAYDSTLNRTDPASPLPMRAAFLRDTENEWDSFEREGHTLWRALRAARPDLRVTYHSTLLERAVGPDSDELLDLLDDAGEVIGVVWRSEAEQLPYVRGVNAFLRNAAGELFIPRRAAHKTRWPGALDFSVGGQVVAGETFNDAFKREAREELNLDVDTLGWHVKANFSPFDTTLSSFMRVYEVPFEGTPALNPEDFSSGEWLTPGEVLTRVASGEAVKDDLIEVIWRVYGKQ
ncbi:NUDIX hydrolase [Deinococcus aluminii]|uniref:Isopentenyl-diphosphate Delta-isomerase n=1 Tax=Deinococcus aluminii TaxID=1656885 RepID=A0ABP9XAN8_9DEIO